MCARVSEITSNLPVLFIQHLIQADNKEIMQGQAWSASVALYERNPPEMAIKEIWHPFHKQIFHHDSNLEISICIHPNCDIMIAT